MLSCIANGESYIRDFLNAEDPIRTVEAFRQMGIRIDYRPQTTDQRQQTAELIVHGKGLMGLREPEGIIDCGNSGTTMRLLSGILAGQPFTATLTGDESLRRRPMQRIIRPLTEMGAVIKAKPGGYPPLQITGGNLMPIRYRSPVASAQVKSAILLAGLYCDGVTSVIEPEKSRDHTERMLGSAGIDMRMKGLEIAVRGRAEPRPLEMTIPGDFSSAAFFIVAATIVPDSEIVIRHTGINPTRTGLVDIMRQMGAHIDFTNMTEVSGEPVADIYVKHSKLRGIEIGSNTIVRTIDEFPVLCVAASLAEGTTRITGASELRVKESDRIATITTELRRMGVKVEELEDGIVIEGYKRLRASTIHSHGDHRVAMAMAVAGLIADGITIIEDTECVNTSFPGFAEVLKNLVK
jgi:3-phosphoshikimate 1-carboxyvinyltransferase